MLSSLSVSDCVQQYARIKISISGITVALVMRLLAVLAEGANPKEPQFIGRWSEELTSSVWGIIAARFLCRKKEWNDLHPAWFLPAAAVCVLRALAIQPCRRISPRIQLESCVAYDRRRDVGLLYRHLSRGRTDASKLVECNTARFGEISYSVYLVHFVILFLIIQQRLYVQLTGNGYYDALITTLLVALPATTAVCPSYLQHDRAALPDNAASIHRFFHPRATVPVEGTAF